jgi:cyclomaltodextrinase
VSLWHSNLIWYQLIPDRRTNGSQNNDATTWPLDRNWIPKFAYNGITLHDAWLQSGLSLWNKDRFVLTDLENSIAQTYAKNNSITLALAKSSVMRNRWFGGDFQGIKDNFNHLIELWIDIVLMHPVWLSDSSMRYDVKDRRHIDPRLTNEFDNTVSSYSEYVGSWYGDTRDFTQSDKEFFQLIQQFHDKGIRVVLDMSLLYASASNYLIKDVALYGKDSPYYERFDFIEKKYKNNFQSCSLSFFYDTKDYPEVEDIYYQWWRWDCSKIYIRRWIWDHRIPNDLYDYYIKIMERRLWTHTIDGTTYKGIDWIRIDASGEFPYEFLSAFYKDIKKINPDAIVMAEERSTDIRTIGNKEADTLSFYPIRLWAEALLIQQWRGLADGISSLLEKIEQFYKNSMIDNHVLMNYLWSHDTDRIMSRLIYTNRDLAVNYFRQWNIDVLRNQWHFARDAPWISRTDHDARYIHTKPAQADISLLKWLIAFKFIMPGSPVIYYGDEVGMYWADDPDNRQPMRWNISDHFPRHICKRWDIWEDYCYTDGSLENYSWDADILQRYKTMIQLKKESSALNNGTISMHICYQNSNTQWCVLWSTANRHPIRWVHRVADDDHIIYLGKWDITSTMIKVQTNVPKAAWKNIVTDDVLYSDDDWFTDITEYFKNNDFLLLKKK